MRIATYGNISASYNPKNIEDKIAIDIAQIIFRYSSYSPKSFYNKTCPKLLFELIKDNKGYQLLFVGYSYIPDTLLQYTKHIYKALQKQYSVSIVFVDDQRNITLEYSNRNYWKTLLKNNFVIYLLLPPLVFISLFICYYLNNLLSRLITNSNIFDPVLENYLYPLICYPYYVLAFHINPMITITKIISLFIILLTAFGFYFYIGNGLIGALLLLLVFILKIIINYVLENF